MSCKSVRSLTPMLALLGAAGVAWAQAGAPAASHAAPPPAATPTAAASGVEGQPDWLPPKDSSEFLQKYYRVFKIDKSVATKIGKGRVKLLHPLTGYYEIVREDDQYYYIRNLPIEDKDSFSHKTWIQGQNAEVRGQMREEFMADKYIIVGQPDTMSPFVDKLDFARMDDGLPKVGRWLRSLDVADMNGDGRPDLILPPERMGPGIPSIWLQQKDGTWQLWKTTRWPSPKVTKLDYGTVRVADFDGDGHPDIAIASHVLPAYVLYGDGKGNFTKAVTLPVLNPEVTAQALVVADFNHDGRPDIALEDELDIRMGTGTRVRSGLVNVMLNLPQGWKANGDDFPVEIFGYGLAAADVTGHGAPDLILTSRQQGVRDLVFRNAGNGEKWESVGSRLMPFNGFVYAVATGALDRFPQPDMVACFQQHNPREREEPTQACTIYRFHDEAGKPLAEPRAELLLKRKAPSGTYQGVAVGDVDGDGRNDIAIVENPGKLHLFLQLADGQFYEQHSPLFDMGPDTTPWDVRIADLRGDGRGEIIVMGAPSSDKAQTGGGLWVFAPRPKPARSGP